MTSADRKEQEREYKERMRRGAKESQKRRKEQEESAKEIPEVLQGEKDNG